MFVLHAAKLLIDRGVASGGAVGAIAPSMRILDIHWQRTF